MFWLTTADSRPSVILYHISGSHMWREQRTLDSWLLPHTTAQNVQREPPEVALVVTRNMNPPAAPSLPQPLHARTSLVATARETLQTLPIVLRKLPDIDATRSEAHFLGRQQPGLQAHDCPKHRKKAIRIVNEDTFNAAIEVAFTKGPGSGRVAVLNMASHSVPGGGWENGAMAQEEALCYRSSLSLSLHKKYYPFKQRMGLYTGDVVIIRSDLPSGHKLLDVQPEDLPVVSVLSIAALRGPRLRKVTEPGSGKQKEVYADPASRELTKDKMRLCLRMAAQNGHGLLVLGALGCGVFRNPPEEVAKCWLEVFQEAEFQGGWWEEVWFAVYDRRGEGNFAIFDDILGGVEV